MSDSHLLTAREAGTKLRMLSARVVRFANRGILPCVRLPDGEIRFDSADLDEWIEQHKKPAEAAK